MKYILIVNAGSSSVKLAAIPYAYGVTAVAGQQQQRHKGLIEINQRNGEKTLSYGASQQVFPAAVPVSEVVERWIVANQVEIAAIGHRVVHGGARFTDLAELDAGIIEEIDQLSVFAPLHNPHAVQHMRHLAELGKRQFAYFDTAFHRTIPEVAHRFAIGEKFYFDGIRRYGFHGIAYESILQTVGQCDAKLAGRRIVALHLGNGCSVCAINGGQSLDTTMGFTPLDGLIMGTRSGSIDPGVVGHLAGHYQLGVDEVIALLNKESGLLGVSGISSDVRDLTAAYGENPAARLAIEMFCYRLSRFVHSFIGLLGGIDLLTFSGGIGQNSALIRDKLVDSLAWLGIKQGGDGGGGGLRFIEDGADSRARIAVVEVDEEGVIAEKVWQRLQLSYPADGS